MDPTRLVLGSGEVYFDPFAPGTRTGTGEIYIASTQNFTLERRVVFAEAKKSTYGVLQKSMKSVAEETVIVSFTTEDMKESVMALWYGGESSNKTRAGAAAQLETFDLVPGRFYQLGLPNNPGIGVSDVFGLSIKVDGNFVTSVMLVDEKNGRFGVPIGRGDMIGKTATVEYEVRTSTRNEIVSTAKAVREGIHGTLRYIARNAKGRQQNLFFPRVVLSPRDQFQVKSLEQWQTLAFEGESLAPMIAYGPRSVGTSPGEQALIDENVDPSGFIVIDGVLSDGLEG